MVGLERRDGVVRRGWDIDHKRDAIHDKLWDPPCSTWVRPQETASNTRPNYA